MIGERVIWAREFGKRAYHEGKMAVPALDPLFCELLKGLAVGEAIKILDAWTRAWHSENMAAPVTE